MNNAMLVYVVALVALFYFLIIRPQRIRQKEMQAMLAALSEGDRVITAGGIHGTVVRVNDSTVLLRVHDDTVIEFEKLSIGRITQDVPGFPEVDEAEASEVAEDPDATDA